MKILARHLLTFTSYARLRDLSQQEVWKLVNTSPPDTTNQELSIPVNDFYRALHYINEKLNDSMLGLRVGECLNLAALGLVYQISLQASTVEEGLLYLKSYLNATFPVIELDIVQDKEAIWIYLNIPDGEDSLNRIILESTLTIIYRELSLMAGEPLPARLYSPYYQANYPGYWEKGNRFLISFKLMLLKAAIADKSRLHIEVLVPEYLKLIERIKAEESFTCRVKIAALQMARPELPGLERVAGVFHMTPRTLQRRLSNENHSFRQLTDELKKQLSYMLIHHIHFTVADIAYVLGYAEPAAFIHSFRKWYGHSPQRFRQQLSPNN